MLVGASKKKKKKKKKPPVAFENDHNKPQATKDTEQQMVNREIRGEGRGVHLTLTEEEEACGQKSAPQKPHHGKPGSRHFPMEHRRNHTRLPNAYHQGRAVLVAKTGEVCAGERGRIK